MYKNLKVFDLVDEDVEADLMVLISIGTKIETFVHYNSEKDYVNVFGLSTVNAGEVFEKQNITENKQLDSYLKNFSKKNIRTAKDKRSIRIDIFTTLGIKDYFSVSNLAKGN